MALIELILRVNRLFCDIQLLESLNKNTKTETTMYKKVLLLCLFVMASSYAHAQTPDTLFYGNTANIAENPFGTGYIGGTNGYGDTGKYQRFDFDSEVNIVGARLHFALIEMGGGAFDNVDIVVRAVAANGAPGEIIGDMSINLSQASVGEEGNYFQFVTPVELSELGLTSVFIGIEWAASVDDSFTIYLDSDGEGDTAGRAWERFEDGSYNDFGTQLNPTFSWGRDADLWIGAVYTPKPTSVDSDDLLVRSFGLAQNYPNPFNPSTVISYTMSEQTHTRLEVFNLVGQSVAILVNEQMPQGTHSVSFNADNLPSGVYMYRLTASSFSDTKKLTLIK